MLKTKTGFYSLFAFMSLLVAPIIRFLSVYYFSYFLAGIYVFLVIAALAGIAIESLKTKSYASAFEFKNPFHLDLFSYIAAAGFFLNFVMQCVMLYHTIKGGRINMTYVLPIIMSGITALVSSGYFIIVGFSFSGRNYDFRQFRLVHIIPMLWAVSCVFNLIEISSGFEKSIDSILKYSMMTMLICFFYSFALEIDVERRTRNTTVLFARAFSYLAVMFFIDRLALVLAKKAVPISAENFISLTCVMLCGFTFFFEKNILHNYINSEYYDKKSEG